MKELKNMTKLGKTLALVFLIVVCLGITIPDIVSRAKDKTPPVIEFAAGTRRLSVKEYREIGLGNYTCLLTDVTATDDVDGNVNDRTVVLRFNESSDSNYAVAVYCSVDSNLNETRIRRIFYLPSQSEILASIIEEADLEEADSAENTDAGTPEIPVLILNTDIVIIKQNGKLLDIADYVSELHDDKDSVEELLGNVHTIGKISFTTAGTYNVYIYVEDSDGNVSEPQKVCIIVEN